MEVVILPLTTSRVDVDTKMQIPALSLLEGDASAELRDSLVAEINALGSNDDATDWAQRRIADKDRLSAA